VAALLAFIGPTHAWWGWPSLLLTTALAPLILASYLPGPGSRRLIDVGCSPCAALAGGAVLFAVLVRMGNPDSLIMAGIAALALVAALRQRLLDATACAAPRHPSPQ
jgi:hypothetical protein